MPHFLYTLARAFIATFSIRNLPWHLLAIVLTTGIVFSGLDWQYLLATEHIYRYFFSAAIVGGLVPILAPVGLWIYGAACRNPEATRLGTLMALAALLGSLVSSVYKAFTGRIQPNLHDYAVDISHGFHFGFLKHGIFWGWPSSHTTIAFSMAAALAARYPGNRTLRYLAFLYAALIGIGVSMSIHWLSDAVAGVIIGTVVGREAARAFADRRP